jgi:hypothetical protein
VNCQDGTISSTHACFLQSAPSIAALGSLCRLIDTATWGRFIYEYCSLMHSALFYFIQATRRLY